MKLYLALASEIHYVYVWLYNQMGDSFFKYKETPFSIACYSLSSAFKIAHSVSFYFSVSKKESRTVLDLLHLPLHLLLHPVLEKKRIARKKEMKSSKLTTNRKNTLVLQESAGQEAPL